MCLPTLTTNVDCNFDDVYNYAYHMALWLKQSEINMVD